jgi:hypothetical protein
MGAFLAEAARFVGDPYVFGAAGPSAFDCSGLVQYSLEKIGLSNVPRTSEAQYAWVQHVSEKDLQPGDLIFEQWPGDQSPPGHVAIYTGTGKIEEAAQPGVPVHVVPWSPGQVSAEGGRVVGYGRIPGLAGGGPIPATLTAAGGGLLSWPSDIIGFFTSAGTAVDWLLQPNHWVRIMCGAIGTGSVGAGVFMMSHTGGEIGEGAMIPRAASLPIGILLTGVGGVLLFVAFHNLPSSVTNLPDLIGYLVASAGKQTTPTSSSSGSGGGGGPAIPALPSLGGPGGVIPPL